MAGYGSDADFLVWISENGLTIPATPTPAVLRERGSAYLDAMYGRCFRGVPTGGFDQERAWPRTGAQVNGQFVPDDLIPRVVVTSSYRAAVVEATSPGSLETMTDPSRRIKRQKVEFAVEREFFEGGADGMSKAPSLSTIDGLLYPYVDAVCMGWEDGESWAWVLAVGA